MLRFPHTFIEHQRRLRFFDTSQKAQPQVCSAQRLSRAASPVVTSTTDRLQPDPLSCSPLGVGQTATLRVSHTPTATDRLSRCQANGPTSPNQVQYRGTTKRYQAIPRRRYCNPHV